MQAPDGFVDSSAFVGVRQQLSNGKSRILRQIGSPADLRKLNIVELRRLAAEIRELMIETVSRTGGHLAPSLGTVELTLALHYVFNTPEDRLVWDVGHQCYTHKIVTGRADRFETLRQQGGLSGFPKRAESPYDTFDSGHSGDSISIALGMAIADRLGESEARGQGPGAGGQRRKTIAVVGDGSMAAGMAFEALNCAGGSSDDLVVILNDNEMSIARSSGGFADYLNRIITGQSYNRMKADVWNLLGRLPTNLSGTARLAAHKVQEGLKNLVAPSVIFEELGFRYFGPFDGHNLISLIDIFRKVRTITQPILIHVVTRKGKGYPPAEQRPEVFHGVGKFDLATGVPVPAQGTNFTQAFGSTLLELARKDPKIVAITAGMCLGTGLSKFRDQLPGRLFDTGITEQHAVAFAAGLALKGMRPVVAIYSTFLARAFDQVVQDVCLQNVPVVLAIDRAGLVGEDGPTHHGNLDLSYLRCVPNLTIMAPANEEELKVMLEFTLQPRTTPIAIRYPRGASQSFPGVACSVPPVVEGKGVIVAEKSGLAAERPSGQVEALDPSSTGPPDHFRVGILAIGSMVMPALAAGLKLGEQGVESIVANMRFVKPFDTELLDRLAAQTETLVVVEENSVLGGFGAAVLEAASAAGIRTPIERIGLADCFLPHAPRNRLLAEAGLDPDSIAQRVLSAIKSWRR